MKPKSNPFLEACQKGDLEKINQAIKDGANLGEIEGGHSPLHFAIAKKQEQAVRVLLDAGAPLEAGSAEKSPLHPGTPLYLASGHGFVPIVKMLLEKGANPNPKSPMGISPLLLATQEGHVDVVKLLIDAKADLKAKDSNKTSVFHYVVLPPQKGVLDKKMEKRKMQIASLLRDAGADINVAAQWDQTPLDVAKGLVSKEFENFLWEMGAKTFEECSRA